MNRVNKPHHGRQHHARKRASPRGFSSNLDSLLEKADSYKASEYNIGPGITRPRVAIVLIEGMGLSPNSRLTYVPDVEDHSGRHRGISCLFHDIKYVFEANFACREPWTRFWLLGGKNHVLSYLDAAASLPPSRRTTKMTDNVRLISTLSIQIALRVEEQLWSPEKGDERTVRIRRCALFSAMQRVCFYKMRSNGTKLADFEARVRELRHLFQIPSDWDAQEELVALETETSVLVDAVHQRFFEAEAEKEIDGPPIPIEDFSSLLSPNETAHCSVCSDQLTPPGVCAKPCGHTYCASCLLEWVHSARKTSHQCPYCRSEMMSPPELRYKHPEVVDDYQRQIDAYMAEDKQISRCQESLERFDAEIELQRKFEVDIHCADST